MKSITLYFHHLRIVLEGTNEVLLDRMVSYHDFLCAANHPDHTETIAIRIDSTQDIEHEYIGNSIMSDDMIMKRFSARKIAEISINPHTNSVTAIVPSPDDFVIESIFESVFMQPLKYLAKKYGMYFMHASSVALDPDHGIVFIGNQHAGKSTMALALLLNGSYYMAEESPAITLRDGEPVLLGFPEPIGVSWKSLENFPQLSKYCGDTTGPYMKHRIKFDSIFPNRTLDECRPAAIFFPEYREEKQLEFQQLDSVEALRRLLDLELEIYKDEYNLRLSQKHMNALGILAQSTRSYRLLYNDSHLSEIPGRITRLLTDGSA